MGIATIDDIASEFLRIIEEGWNPEIDEFLRHVPEDLREPARRRILEMTGRAKSPETSTATDETAEHAASTPEKPVEIVVKSKPSSGPQRLTPEEARQMFREMEQKRRG